MRQNLLGRSTFSVLRKKTNVSEISANSIIRVSVVNGHIVCYYCQGFSHRHLTVIILLSSRNHTSTYCYQGFTHCHRFAHHHLVCIRDSPTLTLLFTNIHLHIILLLSVIHISILHLGLHFVIMLLPGITNSHHALPCGNLIVIEEPQLAVLLSAYAVTLFLSRNHYRRFVVMKSDANVHITSLSISRSTTEVNSASEKSASF